MSCLSKVGCLTVVVAASAAAWWVYGGSMPAWPLRADASLSPAATATGATAGPPAWSTVTDARIPSANAIATLQRQNGPAYITLAPGDVAGFLAEGLEHALPQSAKGVQVAIIDDLLRVRGEVPLRELGRSLPEFVSNLLTDRDTIELAGTLEIVRPGLAQFRVKRINVRGVELPPRLVPPVMGALRRKSVFGDSIAANAVAVQLPPTVADVRVSRGRVTLYKAVLPR